VVENRESSRSLREVLRPHGGGAKSSEKGNIMSVTRQSSDKARFSVANHIGHGLGVLICAGNVLVGISPEAREGDGYNGNIWIAFVVLGTIGVVALLASWITRAGAPRRIGGIALVLVGVASLGVLFVPDIGTEGRIANSVGALLQFGAAALVLLPSRKKRLDVTSREVVPPGIGEPA
jgi:hypothetical protein